MGCEQSSEGKVTTPQHGRWSLKILPEKIQVQTNGNATAPMIIPNTMEPQASEKIRELLLAYLDKEEEINKIEKNEPLTMFYIKKSHLDNIKNRISQLDKRIAETNSSADGRRDGKSVKNVLVRFGDKKLSKEDHEVLANSNKLEIALTELEMAHQEKALVENEVRNLQSTLLSLRDAYKQQEELLAKLSGNKETIEESKIESELIDLESKRMKISEIYERWKEGRVQVLESCRNFSTALQKWRSLPADSNCNQLEEYELGEDIRDDLVNATQCLSNAKFYLYVELPYCSAAELAVLDKALTYLFIDLRSEDRRKHAELCYSAIHKRAVALFAWVDKTVELVIEPDLRNLTRVINEKINLLKQIRSNEIRKKYPDVRVIDKFYGNGNEDTVHLSDMDIQSNLSTLDLETEKTLHELEFDQLVPLPGIEEIVTAGNKNDALKAAALNMKEVVPSRLQSAEIVTHRRNTLTRKLFFIEDSLRE